MMMGGHRTQPLLFGLLILPAWDIIDPTVSDRKWIDCGPLISQCMEPNNHCALFLFLLFRAMLPLYWQHQSVEG